jgi:hypothetical protein
MNWAVISWHSILLVPLLLFETELLQGSTWGWTCRVISCILSTRCSFLPNKNAVFQDYNAPIHRAETVQSWFEEHEVELQHFP